MPEPQPLKKTLGQFGIGDGHKNILYSRNSLQLSTQVWWMLYDIGLDNIAILDSGLSTWAAGGREISLHPASYPPAKLLLKRRKNVFVGKTEVHGAIKNEYVCTMNALNSNIP